MSKKPLTTIVEDIFKSITVKTARVSQLISAMEQENAHLKEQLQEANIPVRHYNEGGVIYAVYGTSSISYVEVLREKLLHLQMEVEGDRK